MQELSIAPAPELDGIERTMLAEVWGTRPVVGFAAATIEADNIHRQHLANYPGLFSALYQIPRPWWNPFARRRYVLVVGVGAPDFPTLDVLRKAGTVLAYNAARQRHPSLGDKPKPLDLAVRAIEPAGKGEPCATNR